MAIRSLLIGTEQGSKFKYLMNTLPIKNIFAEKVDPTNKPFNNDYLTSLTLCRTFDQAVLKKYIEFTVKVIIALQGLSFFSQISEGSSVSSGFISE